MNGKKIVELAEKLGLCTIIEDAGYEDDALWFDANLIEFANEIARIEREECAKICEEHTCIAYNQQGSFAAAIRNKA